MDTPPRPSTRSRRDRCPGAFRPWPAEDGLLVRLRLIGGRLTVPALRALLEVSERFGDGRLHLTSRANLQLRGLPGSDGVLSPEVLCAIEATGVLPSRTHELVRNVMVSPQTGLAGGRADLRPVAAALDRGLRSEPLLADLPGRFLFVLDDGRGDLLERRGDLGLVALDAASAQLRVGDGWGRVGRLADAPGALLDLAVLFLRWRGHGPSAPWHVRELSTPLDAPVPPDPGLPAPAPPLPYGEVPGGRHVEVPDGVLDRPRADALLDTAGTADLVVTPWHAVLIPRELP